MVSVFEGSSTQRERLPLVKQDVSITPSLKLSLTIKLVEKVAIVALAALTLTFASLYFLPPLVADRVCILSGAVDLYTSFKIIKGWNLVLEAGLDAYLKDGTISGNKQEAVKRIRKAWQQKTTSLDLYGLQLTALPSEIGLLTKLTELKLGKNQLTNLPSEIGQLTQLTKLYLWNNRLTALPAEIGLLAKLTRLDLSDNQLADLPSEIGQLTQLTWLNLWNNRLTVLPAEIGQLTQLRSLSLGNNQLTALPAEIGLLTQLTWLNLENNQLTALPAEIGLLTKLTELNLSFNRIAALPAEIRQLTKLTTLDLGHNQLAALPAEIGQLTQLRSLSLGNNQLTTLPSEIGQLTQLSSLSLGYNQLTTLPSEIGQLTQLRSLSLGNNQLTALPAEIGLLTQLTALSLGYNQLTTLPSEIGQLTQLTWLSSSHNPTLRELPMSIGNIPGIYDLDFEDTGISPESLDAILAGCRAIRNRGALEALPSRLDVWKGYAGLPKADLSFISELEENDRWTLGEWLLRLSKTSEFARAQKKLALVVVSMLLDLKGDEEFRKAFIIQAEENNAACGDRAAMGLNELYTFWRLLTLEKSNSSLKEKLTCLVGCAKTLALRKELQHRISDHEKSENRVEREAVEIFLYYETQLKQELGLVTAVDSMIYARIGKRAWINVRALKKTVQDNMLQELISLKQFETLKESDPGFKEDKKQLIDDFSDEIDSIMDSEALSEQAKNEAIAEVGERQNVALGNLVRKWVQAQLK